MSSAGDLDGSLYPLRATIVEYDHCPNECTIHPVDPPSEQQITEWITAREGSYVPLSNCR